MSLLLKFLLYQRFFIKAVIPSQQLKGFFLFPCQAFAVFWVYLQNHSIPTFPALIISLALTGIGASMVLPFIGIALKWLIIGRYREGRYPVWGSMYLRWWLVEQILAICGRGVLSSNLPLYYQLLGAKIGAGAKISPNAVLGEFDLVSIGPGAAVDAALVRGFCVDRGSMVLAPVAVGAKACVGPKSAVAPGAAISAGKCLGPLTSSHEAERDAHPRHLDSCRPTFPGGKDDAWRYWLIGRPCLYLIAICGAVPWFVVLYFAVEAIKPSPIRNFEEAVHW